MTTPVLASLLCRMTKDLDNLEVLRFGNSKAESVPSGVTNSGTQPFPRQNRGEETMTEIHVTRSYKSPNG